MYGQSLDKKNEEIDIIIEAHAIDASQSQIQNQSRSWCRTLQLRIEED